MVNDLASYIWNNKTLHIKNESREAPAVFKLLGSRHCLDIEHSIRCFVFFILCLLI